MNPPIVSPRNGELGVTGFKGIKCRGVTLIELMSAILIIAIGVALAVPSFSNTIEKRKVTSAAEQVASFIGYVQSEAVKRNEKVSFSWFSPGGHSDGWCIGASAPPQSIPCNCLETNPASADFCSIESAPYRLSQTDFIDMSNEFMHMNPRESSFSFDPVRGIVVDVQDSESVDGDYLFYVHSPRKNADNKRLYEMQMKVNVTGRVTICTEPGGRASSVAGYPIC